ncbi:MAG: YdeI/OmpD-associated family protein [Hyphomicrobiales bacterium]
MEPTFFANRDQLRAWFQANHATASELLVGFHKKATGRPSVTWDEAVEEALCFGWIDSIRRSHGPDAYTNRFTPRRPGSTWSNVNVARAEALIAAGKMREAGLRAFEAREASRTGIYSSERTEEARLEPAEEAKFRANAPAWEYFSASAPSYRRAAIHWVVRAKRPETRQRRLEELIADSAAGRRIRALTPRSRREA